MKTANPKIRKTIGRSDIVDFPELGLSKLKAKIDSGAFTSAIHCCKIEKIENHKLRVIFLDEEDPKYTGKVYTFDDFSNKRVRSSNGISEDRFIITTKLKLGKVLYGIDLSLTYRGDMRSPVLIGRKFLAKNHFLVNPRLRNHIHKASLRK